MAVSDKPNRPPIEAWQAEDYERWRLGSGAMINRYEVAAEWIQYLEAEIAALDDDKAELKRLNETLREMHMADDERREWQQRVTELNGRIAALEGEVAKERGFKLDLIRDSISDLDAIRPLCQPYTDVEGDSYGVPGVVDIVTATITRLTAELKAAEDAMHMKGYQKSCDIQACNCGDQWNHGGNADERLRELRDELDTNGVTILDAVKALKAELMDVKEQLAEERLREEARG